MCPNRTSRTFSDTTMSVKPLFSLLKRFACWLTFTIQTNSYHKVIIQYDSKPWSLTESNLDMYGLFKVASYFYRIADLRTILRYLWKLYYWSRSEWQMFRKAYFLFVISFLLGTKVPQFVLGIFFICACRKEHYGLHSNKFRLISNPLKIRIYIQVNKFYSNFLGNILDKFTRCYVKIFFIISITTSFR